MSSIMLLLLMGAIAFIAYAYIEEHSGVQKPTVQAQPTQKQLFMFYEQLYLAYCEILMDCISANYSTIGLCRPTDLRQHMAPNYMGVTIDEYQRVVFHYVFDRSPGPSSGGIGKNTYSTYPANDMKKKLNSVLGNYCVAAGYAPHKITQAEDVGDGRVKFTLV